MINKTKSTNDAAYDKQLSELQGRITHLEDILHQGKEVLNLDEAAKFMDISRSTLYKMPHEQVVPFYKPNGKMVFFEKAALLAWIQQNRYSSKTEISEEARRIIRQLANK